MYYFRSDVPIHSYGVGSVIRKQLKRSVIAVVQFSGRISLLKLK